MRVNYHTSRLLGYWPNYLVLYGFHGEVGDLQLQADNPWEVTDTGNAQAKIDGNTLTLHYWITDRPQVIHTNHLNIVILTQAYAERWWPLPDGSFLCGPDLVLEDGTISETGVLPCYEIRNAELGIRNHAAPHTQQIALEWEDAGCCRIDRRLAHSNFQYPNFQPPSINSVVTSTTAGMRRALIWPSRSTRR